MCRRGENIYKRKDGRWEGRYCKGRKSDGKIKYGYIYAKTYKDVKNMLNNAKASYKKNIINLGMVTTTFDEMSQQWIYEKKRVIKQSTFVSYEYKLFKYVSPHIGKCPMNSLTKERLQDLVDQWEIDNLSTSTIKILLRIVNQCLQYAENKKLIKRNYLPSIVLPKNNKSNIHSLSIKDQKKLEYEAERDQSVYGSAIIFSLRTGLRIGEISALEWDSVDLKSNLIHVKKTIQRIYKDKRNLGTVVSTGTAKTDSSNRLVPISNKIRAILLDLKKKSTSKYVFSNNKSFCEPRLLTYHFHRIRKKASLETIHFHQLRHTFATRCVEANSNIASLSSLLGHSSTKTTLDIYVDSFLEQKQKTICLMDALIL